MLQDQKAAYRAAAVLGSALCKYVVRSSTQQRCLRLDLTGGTFMWPCTELQSGTGYCPKEFYMTFFFFFQLNSLEKCTGMPE